MLNVYIRINIVVHDEVDYNTLCINNYCNIVCPLLIKGLIIMYLNFLSDIVIFSNNLNFDQFLQKIINIA